MRVLLGALTAVTLLVGVAASQPAEARCFWNGFALECYRPYYHHYGYWHHWRPYWAERHYWGDRYWGY